MALLALSIVDPAVGVVAIGCSAAVFRQRNTGTAILLCATGICWFLGAVFPPLVFLHRGPLTQLILCFPSGRVRGPLTVIAVTAGYVSALLAGWFPSQWVPFLSAILTAGASIHGYLRTTGHLRKAALPALVAGLAFAGVVALSCADQVLRWEADLLIAVVYDLTVFAVLLGLTLALRFGRWTDAAVADLVTQLDESDPAGVTRELRRALGDPGLIVGYWSTPEQAYLDAAGNTVDADTRRGGAATPIMDRGEPTAILIHDPALAVDSTLIAGSTAVLRIAAANARMRAEVEQQVTRLAVARQRIVINADEQRAALEARVVSGPERHLAAMAEYLALLDIGNDDAIDAILKPVLAELDAARRELRQFVRGIRPAVLSSGGLKEAVPALAARAGFSVDVRVAVNDIDPEVESAVYFLCSEGLTNIAKHSGATVAAIHIAEHAGEVIVRVWDNGRGGADPFGSGLRGIGDRIEALGGRFTVGNGPDGGTELLARVPARVAS